MATVSMSTPTNLVTGKLEVTIKISSVPASKEVANKWREFQIQTEEGLTVTATVKPKMWRVLEEADSKFPLWVAAIRGRIGDDLSPTGFTLLDPGIQVFEKKKKEGDPVGSSS